MQVVFLNIFKELKLNVTGTELKKAGFGRFK
jgi:hypothetical protein